MPLVLNEFRETKDSKKEIPQDVVLGDQRQALLCF